MPFLLGLRQIDVQFLTGIAQEHLQVISRLHVLGDNGAMAGIVHAGLFPAT